MENGKIDE
jgi:hypothetical protein